MPKFLTNDFKGKELYFDMRPTGQADEEGFYAVPIFESDRKELIQAQVAKGKNENSAWVELLAFSVKKWVGFKSVDGKDIPCTGDNIRELCECNQNTMFGIFTMISDAANMGQVITEKN